MRRTGTFLILLFTGMAFGGEIKISDLPSRVGSSVTSFDSFPFLCTGCSSLNSRLRFSEFFSIPQSVMGTMPNSWLPASPTFGGTVTAQAGSFSGAVSGTTGTFSGAVSGTTGTFSGNVSGVAGTFSGAVAGTTGTFTSSVKAGSSTTGLSVFAGKGVSSGNILDTTTSTFTLTSSANTPGMFIIQEGSTGSSAFVFFSAGNLTNIIYQTGVLFATSNTAGKVGLTFNSTTGILSVNNQKGSTANVYITAFVQSL
jgi:hypothetical protein